MYENNFETDKNEGKYSMICLDNQAQTRQCTIQKEIKVKQS